VRGWVQVALDRCAAAAGSIVDEGGVDSDIEGGLCCDAGCDEIWTEAGVCAQRAEEQGLFGSSPVAHWWAEGQGVVRFGRVPRGRDVGGEEFGEACVGLKGGRAGFF